MQKNNLIKNLPISERPYEKFLKYGSKALSDADLLAIIIKTGTRDLSSLDIAKSILRQKQGNLLNLYEMSFEELMDFPGIGKIKAIQLKAAAELSKRIASTSRGYTLKMNSPASISDYYMEQMRHLREEIVLCAYFDSKGVFLGDKIISKGSITSSMVVISSVFKAALEKNAQRIVLLHNHPSGDASPSRDDISVTDNLCQGAKILGMEFGDHIIIGDNKYYSFFENNLI